MSTHIAETAHDRFFVHAGVVGWNGRAIVIPGQSKIGKTTLVEEFLRIGATYYSDEFAVFDRRGYVHPFARPLRVRTDGLQRKTLSLFVKIDITPGGECHFFVAAP